MTSADPGTPWVFRVHKSNHLEFSRLKELINYTLGRTKDCQVDEIRVNGGEWIKFPMRLHLHLELRLYVACVQHTKSCGPSLGGEERHCGERYKTSVGGFGVTS